jgi:predicted aspartyl protease
MPVSVTYSDRYAWLSAQTNYSNRPFTWMQVHGASGTVDLWALLDTGADYLMLDSSVATGAGINIASGTLTSVNVAGGGTLSLRKVGGVSITVEGKSGSVDALFGSGGTPLLGRTAILGTIDFGIDNAGWLYG